jgi:hypothetical protein
MADGIRPKGAGRGVAPIRSAQGPKLGRDADPTSMAAKQAGVTVGQSVRRFGEVVEKRAAEMRNQDLANERASRNILLMESSRKLNDSMLSRKSGAALGSTQETEGIYENELYPRLIEGVQDKQLLATLEVDFHKARNAALTRVSTHERAERQVNNREVFSAFSDQKLRWAQDNFNGKDFSVIDTAIRDIRNHAVDVYFADWVPGEDPSRDAEVFARSQELTKDAVSKMVTGAYDQLLQTDPENAVLSFNRNEEHIKSLLDGDEFASMKKAVDTEADNQLTMGVVDQMLVQNGNDAVAAFSDYTSNARWNETPDADGSVSAARTRNTISILSSLSSEQLTREAREQDIKTDQALRSVASAVNETGNAGGLAAVNKFQNDIPPKDQLSLRNNLTQRISEDERRSSKLNTALAIQRGEIKDSRELINYLTPRKFRAEDLSSHMAMLDKVQSKAGSRVNQVDQSLITFRSNFGKKTDIGKSETFFQQELTERFQSKGFDVYNPEVHNIAVELIKEVDDARGFGVRFRNFWNSFNDEPLEKSWKQIVGIDPEGKPVEPAKAPVGGWGGTGAEGVKAFLGEK